MTSTVLMKNMFMLRRYGLFKSVIYRSMQNKSFIENATSKLVTIMYTYDDSKILLVKEFFEFLSRTKDIWWLLEEFSDTLKEVTVDIVSQYPVELQKYFNEFEQVFENRSFKNT